MNINSKQEARKASDHELANQYRDSTIDDEREIIAQEAANRGYSVEQLQNIR